MKQNVGPRERMVRVGTGSLALLLAALSPRLGRWRWLVGGLGLMNLATAWARACPTNALLGIDNTRGKELLHFVRSRALGRKLNRWQRRIGATM